MDLPTELSNDVEATTKWIREWLVSSSNPYTERGWIPIGTIYSALTRAKPRWTYLSGSAAKIIAIIALSLDRLERTGAIRQMTSLQGDLMVQVCSPLDLLSEV